jgi:hypothetical protein
MPIRTFTLDEAEALLSVLESLLRSAMEAKKELEGFETEFQQVSSRIFVSGGTLVDIAALKERRKLQEKVLQRVKDLLAEIGSAGVQVKDLDIGLLDFPFQMGDEIILLCWKLGEPRIAHWHTVEEGFKERKPIDERITKANPRPPA